MSLLTLTVSPGEAKLAAEPWAATAPEQSLDAYSLTVEPASEVPFSSGLLSLAGESGSESVIEGTSGAAEFSSYSNGDEQSEVLPAESVAVAVKVAVMSSSTVAVSPGEAKSAAEP